ncbi:MAG: hypothetical protein ACYC5H_08240 [Methylovirgula sp.]
MIHHVSLPAREPERVANVLAELMGGRAYPFLGPLDGAFITVAGDAYGTMIEVYPDTTTMEPLINQRFIPFGTNPTPPEHTSWHVNLSVNLEQAEIERIGAREGWRTQLYGAAPPGKPPVFKVIQFWIENRVLLELVPQSMLAEYVRFAQFPFLDAAVAARQARA